MQTLILGKKVFSIQSHAFQLSAITELVLPPTVEIVGTSAFLAAANLRSVEIGNSDVITVDEGAFAYAISLTQITVRARQVDLKASSIAETPLLSSIIFNKSMIQGSAGSTQDSIKRMLVILLALSPASVDVMRVMKI